MHESAIKRVARTLEKGLGGYRTNDLILIEARQNDATLQRLARDIVAAMRIPTPAMIIKGAMAREMNHPNSDLWGNEWSAMIDAALAE
jgi:hypothetical protein